MCKAFTCVLLKSGQVLWEAGVDSHDKLLTKHNIVDDTSDGDMIKFARIEITPAEGYLHPEGHWTFRVDENTTPRWLTPAKRQACYDALEQWKANIYSKINLEEARNPINPFGLPKREPTPEDIELLHKWITIKATVWATVWATVGATVRDTVWATVWATVGDTIGDTVWAYTGSLFMIDKWGDYPEGVYPFQPAVDLWKRGLVPSCDGKTWRLHSGEKGEIVYKEAIK